MSWCVENEPNQPRYLGGIPGLKSFTAQNPDSFGPLRLLHMCLAKILHQYIYFIGLKYNYLLIMYIIGLMYVYFKKICINIRMKLIVSRRLYTRGLSSKLHGQVTIGEEPEEGNMNTIRSTRMVWLSLVGLCVVLGLTCKPALASSHWDVGVGLGFSQPVYAEGHYETRLERVLIAPQHLERHWVEPVYETRYINGYPQSVLVRGGYHSDVVIPARFEDRYVSVWVPCSRPVVSGGFFGFGFGRGRR